VKVKSLICAFALTCLAFSQMAPIASEPLVVDYTATGLKVASYLLKQQNADGMIPDEPGSQIVNEDSNMEYALIGLAAAYRRATMYTTSRVWNAALPGWLRARK